MTDNSGEHRQCGAVTRASKSLCMLARETSVRAKKQKTLAQVSPEGEELFVVQPPRKQWENLASCLDCFLVLADRPQGQTFVAWYVYIGTGRISGVYVRPIKANVEDDARWENAVVWAAGDFSFRTCPIFRVDILAADDEGVELRPLRCCTKNADASTILAAN